MNLKKRQDLLSNDACMMSKFSLLHLSVFKLYNFTSTPFSRLSKGFSQISAISCTSPLQNLVLRLILSEIHFISLMRRVGLGNKGVYLLQRTAQNDRYLYDIKTAKLRTAVLLMKKGNLWSPVRSNAWPLGQGQRSDLNE